MEETGYFNILSELFDTLIKSFKENKGKSSEIKNLETTDVIFVLLGMSTNNKSKIFGDSALNLKPALAESLLQKGLIQKPQPDEDKYALTFKGIATVIQKNHHLSLEQQFLHFLELGDQKFYTGSKKKWGWDEKLASLSLILVGSTSEASAIRLNNPSNKETLTQLFDETLECLKKYEFVEKDSIIKTKARGELPVMALMSRLNSLARKTNHYYVNIREQSGYYFDIEKDGQVDKSRINFVFHKIFQGARTDRDNYPEMYRRLAEISQSSTPRFLGRTAPTLEVSLGILRCLRSFVDIDIWNSGDHNNKL